MPWSGYDKWKSTDPFMEGCDHKQEDRERRAHEELKATLSDTVFKHFFRGWICTVCDDSFDIELRMCRCSR